MIQTKATPSPSHPTRAADLYKHNREVPAMSPTPTPSPASQQKRQMESDDFFMEPPVNSSKSKGKGKAATAAMFLEKTGLEDHKKREQNKSNGGGWEMFFRDHGEVERIETCCRAIDSDIRLSARYLQSLQMHMEDLYELVENMLSQAQTTLTRRSNMMEGDKDTQRLMLKALELWMRDLRICEKDMVCIWLGREMGAQLWEGGMKECSNQMMKVMETTAMVLNREPDFYASAVLDVEERYEGESSDSELVDSFPSQKTENVNGQLSEEEALAKAIRLSLGECEGFLDDTEDVAESSGCQLTPQACSPAKPINFTSVPPQSSPIPIINRSLVSMSPTKHEGRANFSKEDLDDTLQERMTKVVRLELLKNRVELEYLKSQHGTLKLNTRPLTEPRLKSKQNDVNFFELRSTLPRPPRTPSKQHHFFVDPHTVERGKAKEGIKDIEVGLPQEPDTPTISAGRNAGMVASGSIEGSLKLKSNIYLNPPDSPFGGRSRKRSRSLEDAEVGTPSKKRTPSPI